MLAVAEMAMNIIGLLDSPSPRSKPQMVEEMHDEPIVPNEELEKENIRKTLEKYPNRKEAAEKLDMSERTLYRRIKDFGLN